MTSQPSHELSDPALPRVEIHERGVVGLDADGIVRRVNPRMAEILGTNVSEVIGKDYGQVCADHLEPRVQDAEAFMRSIRSIRGQCAETIEDVAVLRDGSADAAFHRYSSPLFDAEGALEGRVEVFSDITFRRRLEHTIVERNKELAALNEELRRSQEKLVHSATLAALGELSAGVAHHLNNVLGIILGNVQLMLRQAPDEQLRAKLDACELAAMDGAETVRRIRALAKIEERSADESIDVNRLVGEVVGLMKPRWQNEPGLTGGRVEVATDLGELPPVVGSSSELREVLANVILNAVQAMPDGGTISIRTYLDGESVVLAVADTGTGMGEETKRRAFDPFFTTRGPDGTGLGLSIAEAIISKHGGVIRVESEPEKGSEVTIWLPAARTMPGEPEQIEALHPIKHCAELLVVDDEKTLGEVIGQMLAEGGHHATILTGGAEALEGFEKGRYDVLLTDLAMPGMSGCELARAAKQIDPELKVILVTGFGAAADGRDLAEAGIDLVLEKPVRIDQLLEMVSQAIGAGAESSNAE